MEWLKVVTVLIIGQVITVWLIINKREAPPIVIHPQVEKPPAKKFPFETVHDNTDYLYVAFPPGTGLGNRMQAIWASYVLSYIVNRRPVILWTDDIVQYKFEELFNSQVEILTNIEVPENTKWMTAGKDHDIDEMMATVLACTTVIPYFDNSKVVGVKTSQDYTFLLHANIYHYHTIDKLIHPEMQQHFYSTLFRPQTPKWVHTEPYTGLQVRRHDGSEIVKSKHFEGQITVLRGYMTDESEDTLMRCALALMNRSETPLFLASDRRENVLAKVPNTKVLTTPLKNNIELMWHRNSLSQAQEALIDIWALAESEDLIITPGSTFGAAAAVIHGLDKVWTVYDDRCVGMVRAAFPHRWGAILKLSEECQAKLIELPEWNMLCPENRVGATCTPQWPRKYVK